MTAERIRYPVNQKEKFLHALQNPPLLGDGKKTVLKEELNYISRGDTTPDFLEILHGKDLISLMKIVGDNMPSSQAPTEADQQLTSFQHARSTRFRQFITNLGQIAEDRQRHSEVDLFIQSQRKYLGMADTLPDLQELSQIMHCIGSLGLLKQDKVEIMHYFGSFNPYPHKGHVEVARMANFVTDTQTRVVPTTTLNNPAKPELAGNLEQRLGNLHRGFFDEEYATVLGLIGDFNDRKHRISQLSLLGSFDYEKRLRFLMGSDMLIKRVREAIGGDEYAQYILKEDNLLYVSPRNGEDVSQFSKTLDVARSVFSSDIIVLSKPSHSLSGTFIRSLPEDQKDLYKPNAM